MAKGFTDWHRAYVLQGVDSEGNLVAVLLEEGGQLQVLLRGAFGDELRTVALDEHGYLAAYMLDDQSQWGDVIKVGNAELAARLGSLLAWDWRGQVVYQNDFRFGLGGLYTDTGGTGALAEIDPSVFLHGGHSMKLVGGSDGSGEATFAVGLDLPPTDRVGVFFRWASDSTFDFLELWVRVHNGSMQKYGYVRVDLDDSELQYYNDSQAWTKLADYSVFNLKHVWHNIKLVIDTSADTYARCLASNVEYDMTALDLYTSASAGAPRVEVFIKVKSHEGENEGVWIDALAITVTEPE